MQTIPFPQLVGKDYTPLSSKADCQTLWNLYRETIQSGDGDNDHVLYKTPGIKTQQTPAIGSHRGTLELNDYLFDVLDDTVFLLVPTFAITYALRPIANDGKPVIMAANPDTLLIVSAGVLYAINSAALTTPATPAVPISVAFIDGYFVILSAANQIFFSVDGLTWNALDFQTIEASPSNTLAMITDHNELWLLGNRLTQVFTVGPDPNTPFVPRQDAILQHGIAAAASLVALDSSLFWLERNKNGERTIVRMDGYTPKTVSTYAVENTLRKFPAVDDCIGMGFQVNGHSHVWFTFPSAPAVVGSTLFPGTPGAGQTLGYDATENDWYRVGYWNIALAQWERHRANTIVSAFGKILAGDHENGKLYELSPDFCNDDGNPIRWLRRAPHVRKNNRKVQIGRFEVTAEVMPCDCDENGNSIVVPVPPSTVPPVITTACPVVDPVYGVAYSYPFAASGGILPLTWSISAGALPAGLTLNPTTGILSGTPAASGDFSYTPHVADSTLPTPLTAEVSCSLHIAPYGLLRPLTIEEWEDPDYVNPVRSRIEDGALAIDADLPIGTSLTFADLQIDSTRPLTPNYAQLFLSAFPEPDAGETLVSATVHVLAQFNFNGATGGSPSSLIDVFNNYTHTFPSSSTANLFSGGSVDVAKTNYSHTFSAAAFAIAFPGGAADIYVRCMQGHSLFQDFSVTIHLYIFDVWIEYVYA